MGARGQLGGLRRPALAGKFGGDGPGHDLRAAQQARPSRTRACVRDLLASEQLASP